MRRYAAPALPSACSECIAFRDVLLHRRCIGNSFGGLFCLKVAQKKQNLEVSTEHVWPPADMNAFIEKNPAVKDALDSRGRIEESVFEKDCNS